MAITFVNITEEEFLRTKLLYKHLPLENALRTLKDKSLWFANPATWSDPFEKRFLEAKYIKNNNEVKFKWVGKVFCTCMSQTITSEAFWNTYSRGEIGVEFRIITERLLELLSRYDNTYKIFIGKAEYLKSDDIKKTELRKIPFRPALPMGTKLNSDEFAARLFLLKRKAFEYEDEIRIILVKNSATKERGIGLHYDCANTDLIKRVVLDPSLGDYTFAMLKQLFVNNYGFTPIVNNGKVYNRLLRSQLYARQPQAVLKLD